MGTAILVRDIHDSALTRDCFGATYNFWLSDLFHREKEAFLDGGESI